MISGMRAGVAMARALPVLLTLTLAACSPSLATQAPETPTSPAGTSTPAPSPTPHLFTVISGLNSVPSEDGDGWTVIGLVTNRSDIVAGEVGVRVTLEGPGGEEIDDQEVSLAIPHLGPGETAPFSAQFPGAAEPVAAHAEVTRYSPAGRERAEVEVANLRALATVDGRLAVVGTVINRSARPIEVSQLAILASDEDGISLALASSSAHRARLEPGAEGPFLAILPAGLDEPSLTPYADATFAPAEPPSRLTFVSAPVPMEDEQGDVFVVGVIRNGESRPRWASVLVSLQSAGEVVGVAQEFVPIPLGPGESRAFTITRFPRLASGAAPAAGIEGLSVEAWVDPVRSPDDGLRAVPLALQVRSYEAIAGTLFLQGTVENDSGAAVLSATVLAVVRSLDGAPLSAGWRLVAESLEAGESAAFVLELTLPRGADLVMSEYDIVASGLAPAD